MTIVTNKKRIRCQECKTTQGVHKKSCSKSRKITKIRILMWLRENEGLKMHELEELLPIKGVKISNPNTGLQQLRAKKYIHQIQEKLYLDISLKDPVFFTQVCRAISNGRYFPPLSEFLEN